MSGLASTWRSSCSFDSSRTSPALGVPAANGLCPLARKTELFSSCTQPSRIGFGSISGARGPAGRIWKTMLGSPPAPAVATWPSTVPAITCTPARRSCRWTSFGPARNTRVFCEPDATVEPEEFGAVGAAVGALGGGAAGCAAAPGTVLVAVAPGWPGVLSDSADTPTPSSGDGAEGTWVPALAGPV